MQIASFYGWAHVAVAAAYLFVAYRCWSELVAGRGVRPALPVAALLLLAVAVHAVLITDDVFGAGGLRFGFAQALSSIFMVAGALLWLAGFFIAPGAMIALVMPMAALAVLLPLAFHGEALAAEGASLALRVHLGVSMLAYTLFTIAALHSVLMTAIDRHLHQPGRETSRSIGALLTQMPPLLELEKLMFGQLAAGFVLLTASLASGIVFSQEVFGRPLKFSHKTVFGLIAWSIFAGLLIGRYAFGWRGKVAQRWLFFGFVMLLLAYIGSRFVFEVVLDRAWVV
jgi:ABC-type uncharacterized transport system permease subunit